MDSIKNRYADIDPKKINLHINEHLGENEKFNYNSYVEAQTKANVRKLECEGPSIWRLFNISDYIKKHIPNLTFGICHGTRRGSEQKDFKSALNIPVIGTEISHTAEQFPDTIQWDFHEAKEEWLNSVSFIFSNSLDHSYDPISCLDTWMRCISPGGKIFLQRGAGYIPKNPNEARNGGVDGNLVDIFQCTDDAFEKIVALAGNDEWIVLYPEELSTKVMGAGTHFIVLEKKR